MATDGLRLVSVPGLGLGQMAFTPTLWPVIGPITGQFRERMDPFSGEGAFHTGVDISSQYGDAIRATADGVVDGCQSGVPGIVARLVIVDHGFGA